MHGDGSNDPNADDAPSTANEISPPSTAEADTAAAEGVGAGLMLEGALMESVMMDPPTPAAETEADAVEAGTPPREGCGSDESSGEECGAGGGFVGPGGGSEASNATEGDPTDLL